MLNKNISLKELAVVTYSLIVAFFLCGMLSEHPVLNIKEIFMGAIIGVTFTFLTVVLYASQKNLPPTFSNRLKQQ